MKSFATIFVLISCLAVWADRSLAADIPSVQGVAAPDVPAGGVLNNASYMLDNLPSSGIARGSMFAVFGVRMGPEAAVVAEALPLTTNLGGTQVEVTVGGVTRLAFLLVSSAGQLAAIMPSDVPAGNGVLVVIFNGVRSAETPILVVDSAFGIFSRNQAGYGPGILQNFVSATEQPVNSIFDAARAGQVVIIWGTGLGPIDASDAEAPPVGNLPVAVEVWIGGRRAEILYAGRSPQFPGIDQINVVIPEGVTGCYVPVAVVVAGRLSNHVTMAITGSAGPYCSDFQTFLPGELAAIAAEGQAGVGAFGLGRFRGTINIGPQAADVAVDETFGEFKRYGTTALAAAMPVREAIAPFGACIVSFETLSGRSDPIPADTLSAGPQLVLEGPNGVKQIPFDDPAYEASVGGGFGDEMMPPYFDPGVYSLRGGSAQTAIGPFETTLTMPAGPQWLNQAMVDVVRRDQDLTVQWSGADPATQFVSISVFSVNREDNVFALIYCTAPADANSFTIPRRILGALPANTPWDGEGDPTGLMSVNAESLGSLGRIQATGLNAAGFYYALRQVRTVDIR